MKTIHHRYPHLQHGPVTPKSVPAKIGPAGPILAEKFANSGPAGPILAAKTGPLCQFWSPVKCKFATI